MHIRIGIASLLVASAVSSAKAAPADDFLAALTAHCGKAYAGTIVANEPADPKDPFIGQSLVMHVRECGPKQIKVPFHVGDDRSRTWIFTRTDQGLRLKHDHRHADGSPDELTLYGGDSQQAGSATRQTFPVDAESITLFERLDRKVSTTNVWAVELDPQANAFVYELSRPGRLFRVRFDLNNPLPLPPPPWGADAAP